jgi:hypothetical protein
LPDYVTDKSSVGGSTALRERQDGETLIERRR